VRKGSDYERAFADFIRSKGIAEAVVDELRRRGLIRRGRPAGVRAPSAAPASAPHSDFTSSFVAIHSARRVHVSADAHVRFAEKDRTALREAVRAAVRRLRIEQGEVLRAAFLGPKPTVGTDLENLVLYNLGLDRDVLRNGVAFEHNLEPPAGGSVGYEYEPASASAPFQIWRPARRLIAWSEAKLNGYTAPAVWWSLRAVGEPELTAEDDEDLLISCHLSAPRTIGSSEIKGLVDGLLAATQSMPDRPLSRIELVAKSLGALSRQPDAAEIDAALTADFRSVLGPCPRLLTEDGRINPDDHRVVAAVITVDHSLGSGSLILDASVHTAALIRSQQSLSSS
jgi:hypothetical protein